MSESTLAAVAAAPTPAIPAEPLAKIALSCSGGGYRAASFHLGTMSYLNRLQYKGAPLLENVKMLSTVSGGTITGIVYTLMRQQGESFEDIYNFLLDKLRTLDLLKLGIEKLNPDARWHTPTKQKNLINAFAELYDEHFTGRATFAELDKMQCHLEAVAFNSTEFDNGMNFRFRNRGRAFFGNYYLRISNAEAGEIKLADAMAASSCFPGGFEPILWPSDFIHDAATHLQKLSSEPPTGLMDGGIYDNQGIDSILKYKSGGAQPYFDLILISDVASPYMTPYKPTPERIKKGIRRITLSQLVKRTKRINTTISLGMPLLAIVLGLLPLSWGYGDSWGTGACVALAIATFLGWLGKNWLVRKVVRVVNHQSKSVQNTIPPFYWKKLSAFKVGELSIHRAEPLLFDRLNSLLTLLLDVFLKVVRRLNYNILYDDDSLHFRRVSTLINALTEEDYNNRLSRPIDKTEKTPSVLDNSILGGSYADTVGPEIKKVAEDAASFGTTLWFTEEDQLGDRLSALVATGQFTLCYSLIEYLEILIYNGSNGFDALPAATQAALKDLLKQCIDDWIQFKDKPFFLVKKQ